MKECRITELIQDWELYPRNDVSSAHVTALCNAVTYGDPIPPIIVDRKSKRIVDGFHRHQAYKRLKIESVPVVYRDYKSDQDLYADAVRMNLAHGRPFDPYDRKRIVAKLGSFGLQATEIGRIVHLPKGRIEELAQDFTATRGGGTVVLKQGLVSELRGKTLTAKQAAVNERWSGYQPLYHVNQLIAVLDAGITPQSDTFRAAMDRLVELWQGITTHAACS